MSKRPSNLEHGPAVASRRPSIVVAARASLVIAVAAAIGVLLIAQLPSNDFLDRRVPNELPNAPKADAIQPTNATGSSDGIDGIAVSEISETNIVCAAGLPGAESFDVAMVIAELDRWAKRVADETERHLYRFRADPGQFNDSEAYFRMLMLIVVLQQDFGVHYNEARIFSPDFANSQDLFIHGMLPTVSVAGAGKTGLDTPAGTQPATNGGTCVSMPVLYVAIGRRLGYPLRLAVAKGHVFARWEDAKERFNIEGTNRGLETPRDDEYKTWPLELTEAELSSDWYLRSLTPDEERGLFMLQRGYCLEANGLLTEAIVAYTEAHRLAPKSPEASESLLAAQRQSGAAATMPSDDAQTRQRAWLLRKRQEADDHAQRVIEEQQRRAGKPPVGVVPGQNPSLPRGDSPGGGGP